MKKQNKLCASLLKGTTALMMLLTVGCAAGATVSSSTDESSVKTVTDDTTAPTIKLKEKTVTISLGDKFDATENIKSVKDDTDGKLTKTDKAKKDAAYYLVDDSKVDTSKVGEYTVTITAVDKAGNSTTSTYTVKVQETDSTTDDKTSKTKSDSKDTTTASTNNKKTTTSSSSSSKTSTTKKSATTSSNNSSASSNNSNSVVSQSTSTSSQASTSTGCDHKWVAVQYVAGSHEESYEEPVYENVWHETKASYDTWYCRNCQQTFTSLDEFRAHRGLPGNELCSSFEVRTVPAEGYYSYEQTGTKTATKTVIDYTNAYECSKCGATKS